MYFFCLSFVLRAIVLVVFVFCGATPHQRMIHYLAGVRRFLAWCELPVCQLTILVAGGAGLRTVFRACFVSGKRLFFDDRFPKKTQARKTILKPAPPATRVVS